MDGIKSISEMLPKLKKSDFKFFREQTLFPVTDYDLVAAIKQKRCPWCSNKLKSMMAKPKMYCSSPKHKRTFIISKEKVKQMSV